MNNCIKIINQLAKNKNYEIYVLAYDDGGKKFYEQINGIKVFRFTRSLFFSKMVQASHNKAKWSSKYILRLNRILLRIKQLICIPIYPCYEPFVARQFAHNALELQQKFNFDLILAEYHGYETLYAGYFVKSRCPQVKFMPILWDPLTGSVAAKYLPRFHDRWKKERSAAKIFGKADQIIAMKSSQAYHEKNSIQKPYYPKIRYLDLPGIVRPCMREGDAPFIEKDKINIVYAGVLTYPDRDPKQILQVLNQTKYAKQINIIFFSIGNGIARAEEQKKDFQGTIHVSGYVDQATLECVYSKADVLLNLGGPNPFATPSKLFTYMSYGKPIISTYYIDNESSYQYLQQYRNGLCLDLRKAEPVMVEELEAFLDQRLGTLVPFEEVAELYSANTPGEYVRIIESLLH